MKSLCLTDKGKTCPSLEFLASQICFLTLFAKVKSLGKFWDIQLSMLDFRVSGCSSDTEELTTIVS